MTKQSTTALAIALFAIALIGGVATIMLVTWSPSRRTVTVESGVAARKSDPHTASATLGILDLMRQAALEAKISVDARNSALAIIDDEHAKMRAALDDGRLSDAERVAAVRRLNHEMVQRMGKSSDGLAVNRRSGEIWHELDLLSRRRLLPLMFDKLDMTDAQHKAADAAFMEVSVVVRNEPAGGMPNERSMQAMLTGRDKLHALLTPEQRTKLEQVLKEGQARPPRVVTTGRVVSATTRATIR